MVLAPFPACDSQLACLPAFLCLPSWLQGGRSVGGVGGLMVQSCPMSLQVFSLARDRMRGSVRWGVVAITSVSCGGGGVEGVCCLPHHTMGGWLVWGHEEGGSGASEISILGEEKGM